MCAAFSVLAELPLAGTFPAAERALCCLPYRSSEVGRGRDVMRGAPGQEMITERLINATSRVGRQDQKDIALLYLSLESTKLGPMSALWDTDFFFLWRILKDELLLYNLQLTESVGDSSILKPSCEDEEKHLYTRLQDDTSFSGCSFHFQRDY